MIRFQTEKWSEFYPDAKELFPLHWKELAMHKEDIALDCDVEGYQNLDNIGRLMILTARQEGRLVGYLTCFLMHHLHYKSAGLMAMTDMYFVLPEFRNGTGARLFLEWERLLRERGVIQAISSYKRHENHGEFFQRLGWEHTDDTVIKYLGRKSCQ